MNLTEEFIKMAAQERSTDGSSRTEVKSVYDLIQSGMVKEASQRMSIMKDSDIIQLNKMLYGVDGDAVKTAGKAAQGTVSSSAVPIAAAGNREERGEGTSSTETGKTDTSTLKPPMAGGKTKNNQGGGANSPDIGAMLNTPINETLRTPSGENSQEDLKKKAEFIANYKLGMQDAMGKIASLVEEKGKLNMAKVYGEPFAKIASMYGSGVATEIILRAQADGVKEATLARINNQEVKMGSMNKLYEDQSKVASIEDLGVFARELGRISVMNKVANLQAIDEAALPAEGVGGEEVPPEVLAELEALIEQATEAPETLTDEESELLLELSDEGEDQEAALVGEEKVSSVMDIVAALRQLGW